MAWTTPRTWTPGELVTALMMNQHVRDNLNHLLNGEEVSTVLTGTQHNMSVSATATVLTVDGSAPLSISGITGGTLGRVLKIHNDTAHVLRLLHENGSSTDINRILSVNSGGQFIGQRGTIWLVFTSTSIGNRWVPFMHDPGITITPAFVAGDYTAGGSQTWTLEAGDVGHHSYAQQGRYYHLKIFIQTSSVGGTPHAELRIALQQGQTMGKTGTIMLARVLQVAAFTTGLVYQASGASFLTLYADLTGTTNWTGTTNQTQIEFQTSFEIG